MDEPTDGNDELSPSKAFMLESSKQPPVVRPSPQKQIMFKKMDGPSINRQPRFK